MKAGKKLKSSGLSPWGKDGGVKTEKEKLKERSDWTK